jgi:DNA-binding GntR family transcriptional regulator
MIEPLPVQFGLVDQVYDRLVKAITEGRLAPGERITQDELAAKLGVSRQPVSHALHILRRRGLLIEAGRRGLIVAPLDANRLRQLYQVRAALDGLAASLAATRVRSGSLPGNEKNDGRDLVSRGMALVSAGSVGELVAADVAFHSLLHRWSGNEAVVETVAEVWPHFMRSMGTVLADPAIRERVWREHGEIFEAILAGEPGLAAAAARRHTELIGEETAASLERTASVA